MFPHVTLFSSLSLNFLSSYSIDRISEFSFQPFCRPYLRLFLFFYFFPAVLLTVSLNFLFSFQLLYCPQLSFLVNALTLFLITMHTFPFRCSETMFLIIINTFLFVVTETLFIDIRKRKLIIEF